MGYARSSRRDTQSLEFAVLKVLYSGHKGQNQLVMQTNCGSEKIKEILNRLYFLGLIKQANWIPSQSGLTFGYGVLYGLTEKGVEATKLLVHLEEYMDRDNLYWRGKQNGKN